MPLKQDSRITPPILHPLARRRGLVLIIRQRQVNHLRRGPLIGRPRGSRRVARGDAGWGAEVGCREGDRVGGGGPVGDVADLGDYDVVVVGDVACVLVVVVVVGGGLLARAGDGPLPVGLDGDLLDRVGGLGEDLAGVSGGVRMGGGSGGWRDSLVDGQLLERRGLVANGAEPLRALLLQLEVRRRVEALDVVATETAAGQA